jgi:hypothetical protein
MTSDLQPLYDFRGDVPEPSAETARRIYELTIGRTARTRHRRRYASVAGIAAAAALLATPAFGVIGHIRDLFEGTPAPPPITQHFAGSNDLADMANAWLLEHGGAGDRFPKVDPATAHGVTTVDTSDGPLYLWAAQQADGSGLCWFVDFASDQQGANAEGGGSCSGPIPPSRMVFGYGWTAAHPSLDTISGYLYVDATSVQVTLDNGTSASFPVTEHLFVGILPRDAKLTEIRALDASGATVTSMSL